MRVTISDIDFEVENSPAGIDRMFARIDSTMQDFNVYFSHLIVDGIEVADSFHDFIIERLPGVKEVEVAFLTSDQYLYRVLALMEEFLRRAVPEIDTVAQEFYGHYDASTWERFNLVVSLLNQVVQTIQSLIGNPDFRGKVDRFAQLGNDIVAELTKLNDAIVGNDMILAGDILLYELTPFVENLYAALQELSRSERHDIH